MASYLTNIVTALLIKAFIVVALVEEGLKFLVLRYYSFNRKSFDEPLDGIVYSIMVSMGFATLENIFYVVLSEQFSGMQTGVLRMLTAVPGHAVWAVVMGYYVGKAKFDQANKIVLLIKGLVFATILHGVYDAFLFLMENEYLSDAESRGGLFLCAIGSLIISIVLGRKLMKLHRLTSHQLFKATPALTIRNASEKDVKLIRTLALQIWPRAYSKILSKEKINYMLDLFYRESSLLKQMQDQHKFILVYNSGHPIGFASYSEIEHTVFKLQKIYMLSLQQGRGSGRFVIDYIIKDILAKGATALRLNVNRQNTARIFYEKLDFKMIGEEDVDIGNGFFMNDFIMEKN